MVARLEMISAENPDFAPSMTNHRFPTRREVLQKTVMAVASLPLLGMTAGVNAAESDPAPVSRDRTHGLDLSVASYTLGKLPVDEVIAALRKLELRNVALHRLHCPWDGTPEACVAVTNKFRDAGINVTGTGVIWLPNNETTARKAFDNLRAAGVTTMVCQPAPDAFPLLDRLVKEYDIRLAIHNHGPADLYPSPYDSLKAAQPYDQRIGVCFDIGHGYQAGTDPVEAIHRCRERLYDVHLKDTLATTGQKADVPVVVGHGRIDFPGVVAALVAIKYPFRCGFEYEQDVSDRVTGLAESVGYIRGILANRH